MYCRALACDFDGTSESSGQLAPEMAAALRAARAQGIVALLVTGRPWEDVQILGTNLSAFDAVVAENGAVVHLLASGRTIQLGPPPPGAFLAALQARGVPFHAGAVVVGTRDVHTPQVLEIVRQLALDRQPIFNRGEVMLLPTGINKAVGTRRALEELGRSERNLIAFGDAENDLPLFALAEVGVAARGAAPAVAAQADDQLSRPGAEGVAQYIQRLLAQGGIVPTPSRQRLSLGSTASGVPVTLPASGTNVMIAGDPRSGKSFLAGLVAEQLIDHNYRICVIDPEGDYASLAQRPRVMLLGTDLSLPEPAGLLRLFRGEPISLVLNLATLSVRAQMTYVHAVLAELGSAVVATGVPQWILIDESQYFFHEAASFGRSFGRASSYIFATHRPSLVSDVIYATVGGYVITRTEVDEERYFLTGLLQAYGPPDLRVAEALADLAPGCAGLLVQSGTGARWDVFTPGARMTAHAHHARKYADTRLPEDKAFRFLMTDGCGTATAHNVSEFHRAVRTVPVESLQHHLGHGDFSRWATEVLGDQQLGRGLAKLERLVQAGTAPNREEILTSIEDQYQIEPPAAEPVADT